MGAAYHSLIDSFKEARTVVLSLSEQAGQRGAFDKTFTVRAAADHTAALEFPDSLAENPPVSPVIIFDARYLMEMNKINSGKLRAIGYDARARVLQVQLDNGDTLQYSGVGEEIWRRLSTSGSAWSYYRDNIEEEFAAKRVSEGAPAGKNPLDELFGKP